MRIYLDPPLDACRVIRSHFPDGGRVGTYGILAGPQVECNVANTCTRAVPPAFPPSLHYTRVWPIAQGHLGWAPRGRRIDSMQEDRSCGICERHNIRARMASAPSLAKDTIVIGCRKATYQEKPSQLSLGSLD